MLKVAVYIFITLAFASSQLTSLLGQGAGKKIIIFTDDKPYLFNNIETLLSDFADKDNSQLFSKVTNLTRLLENERDEQITDEMRINLSRESLLSVDLLEDRKVKLATTISDHEYFLKVNILTLSDLIEYQFILYNVIKDSLNTRDTKYYSRLVNDIEKPLKLVSFFVNPKSSDYLRVLQSNLKRLFPESNSPPKLKVYLNGKQNISTLYTTLKDTVVLDAGYSFDFDNPTSDLTFYWAQKPISDNDELDDLSLLSINQGEKKQMITFTDLGSYKIEVKAFDGVSFSKKKEFSIYVVDRPITRLARKKFSFIGFNSLTNSRTKFNFNVDLELFMYNKDNISSIELQRISRNPIKKRYIDYVELIENSDSYNYDEQFSQKIDQILRPSVLKVDTIHVSGSLRLAFEFDPRDSYIGIGSNYFYRLRATHNGVPGNTEDFYIRYFSYSHNIKAKYYFNRKIFPEVADVDIKKEISRIRAQLNKKNTYNSITINNSTYIGLLILSRPRFDFEFGFVISNEFVREERFTTYSGVTADPNDELVTYNQKIWSTGSLPSVGFGYRLVNSHSMSFRATAFAHILKLKENRFRYYFSDTSSFPDELVKFAESKRSELRGGWNFFPTIGAELGLKVFKTPLFSWFISAGIDLTYFKGNPVYFPSIGIIAN